MAISRTENIDMTYFQYLGAARTVIVCVKCFKW